MTTTRERQGPLDGLRVIDMSGMISGAFATTLMGDFGADVIMIEHPKVGDPIREWPQKTEVWYHSMGGHGHRRWSTNPSVSSGFSSR